MAMTPYTGDPEVIAKLGTTPQERGLTPDQFKAKFDEAFKEFITEYFNTIHLQEIEELILINYPLRNLMGVKFNG